MKNLITVCDKCFCASCWQGILMCDNARIAGATERTIEQLTILDLEHPSYWGDQK